MSAQTSRTDGMNAPGFQAATISPSDSTDFPEGQNARAIYVGVTGDLTVIMAGDAAGTSVTFKNVPVGIFNIAARRVLSTGTTATQLIRLW